MSRLDDLKKQNPKFDVSVIDVINHMDPTSTHKYTGFLLKLLKNEMDGDDIMGELAELMFNKDVIDEISKFEKHCLARRISNTDITRYKTMDEIVEENKKADDILKQKQSEKQIIKIYDNDDYLILMPLTYDASKTYGANTKWCVTNISSWPSYQWTHKLIFVIDRKKGRKTAFSRKYSSVAELDAWLADDTRVSPLLVDLPDEILSVIFSELKKDKFKTELSVLGSDNLITKEGIIVPINQADRDMIKEYSTLFDGHLTPTIKDILKKRYDEIGLKKTNILDVSSGLEVEPKKSKIQQIIDNMTGGSSSSGPR